jgi:glycosyltransferase involved in cell wall biosynthesis
MPSIAIFVYDLSATGVVRNALAIARHMQDRVGWRVRLLLCRDDGDLAGEAEGLEREVLGGGDRGRRSRSATVTRAIPRLRAALQRDPPDILLSAGNHGHLACWLAVRGMARPARVYRFSNDLAHRAGRLGTLPGAIRRRLVARAVSRDGARLVLVSPRLAEEPVLARALQTGKACVIRNGVPLAEIAAQKAMPCDHPWFAQGVPVVIAVGRLVEQKNFLTLLRAVAQARRTRALRLILLGGGSAENRAQLMRWSESLGLAHAVDFLGRVANPFPYIARSAVLALPSLWEGSANVLLEAMACGTPVVASRTAGNAVDVLDGGRYGVLVDPLDIAGMAQAILRQCDPATRILPGARVEEFDIRRTLDAYAALFGTIVGAVSPPQPTDRSASSRFRYR